MQCMLQMDLVILNPRFVDMLSYWEILCLVKEAYLIQKKTDIKEVLTKVTKGNSSEMCKTVILYPELFDNLKILDGVLDNLTASQAEGVNLKRQRAFSSRQEHHHL